MTEFSVPQFPDHYDIPADQIAAEMELIGDFSQHHPDMRTILASNLTTVHRHAGIHEPVWKVGDPDMLREELGDVDEAGYLKLRPMATGRTVIWLAPLGESEGNAFEINGQAPAKTCEMLDGIYGLIGARALRNDHQNGRTRGRVIRQGMYHGSDIFVAEIFDLERPYSNYPYDRHDGNGPRHYVHPFDPVERGPYDRYTLPHFMVYIVGATLAEQMLQRD